MKIHKKEYINIRNIKCSKNKHKFRENNLGIVYCTICGLLCNSNTNFPKLIKEEKIIIDK